MGTRRHNIAARMGRWSASHRKSAIFGWLAFVAVAFALGGVVGMVHLPMDEAGAGEARRAQMMIKESDRPKRTSESVLVQPRTEGASGAAFEAAIADVAATLEDTDEVVAVARRSIGTRTVSARPTGAPRSSSSRSRAMRTQRPSASTRCSPPSRTSKSGTATS